MMAKAFCGFQTGITSHQRVCVCVCVIFSKNFTLTLLPVIIHFLPVISSIPWIALSSARTAHFKCVCVCVWVKSRATTDATYWRHWCPLYTQPQPSSLSLPLSPPCVSSSVRALSMGISLTVIEWEAHGKINSGKRLGSSKADRPTVCSLHCLVPLPRWFWMTRFQAPGLIHIYR